MTEDQLESLIRKYADGTATEDEIQQLMRWYRTSALNDVYWPSTDVGEKEQLKRRALKRLQQDIKARPSHVIRFVWPRVAAVLFTLLTGIAFIYYFTRPKEKSYVTVKSPSGKIQHVLLPDGSRVWLNASSTLTYNVEFNKTRELKLNGEAFFEVASNVDHPFSVEAGSIKTFVLGTSFNTKTYASDTTAKVSVITGKVKVMEESRELGVLNPAQELTFNKTRHTSDISATDTSNVQAWRKGELRFFGQSLGEIATTLERWYGVRILFSKPRMANCRYYMSFDNSISLDKLLNTMAEITDMRYTRDKENRTITLSGNECNQND